MGHFEQPAKLAMRLVLPLLLLRLSYGMGNVQCSTVHENKQDFHSLLEFKQGINDTKGALSNWNPNTHFCRWNGVKCTLTQPWHVRELNLSDMGLAGQVSSLGNLTSLSTLDLSYNGFTGPLPILNNLQQLVVFYLNNNQLHGVIPDTLTNSSKLAYLDLSVNLIVGSIPRSLFSLSSLTYLNLKTNQLEGSIPDEIGNLSRTMTNLLLGSNILSGSIPQGVFNLYNLQYLSLEYNMLGSELPPDMGGLLPNLIQLTMSNNMIEGHIPASLGDVLGLQMIDLGSNNFVGEISSSFGNLSSLYVLSLGNNSLEAGDSNSWAFFHALTNCTRLTHLDLGYNNLQGTLPNTVGNLSVNLQDLTLGWNNLSGMLPPSIWNLRALNRLSLSNNNFSGTIEEQVENLKDLEGLFLHNNKFFRTIPSSIGNLTKLERLRLDNNNLEGPIPPTLGNLKQLSWLDLSYNKIIGDITPELGNLKQLTDLRLSSNKLSGEIPDTLNQCQQLVTLEMDQNFLIGNISTSFSGLKGLITLNLSHNYLYGTIPTILKDLSLLSKLDLSYNHLQGEIPTAGIFVNATAVSLNGNLRLCGGVMTLHMPTCPASQKTERKLSLTILVIPLFGFMSLVMSMYVIIHGTKTSTRKYLLLLSFGKQFPKVSYNDLAQATGNFSESNLLGGGSYGSVYKGKLIQTKTEVAVKVFDLGMRCADKSFVSECETLRSIRHRNVLPILTACSTIDNAGNAFKALVYEFMPNGNLDTWLHHKCAGQTAKGLGLAQRISIAVDIADGLAYLHNDIKICIAHCDLKPSNILLDANMIAYLGDFGIANLIYNSRSTSVGHSSSNTSIGLKGTIGYISPEYAQSGQVSTKGDVYGFGIVLMEMLTGRRPTDSMFENGHTIVMSVERHFPDQILHIIDPHIHEDHKGLMMEKEMHGCLLSLVQVALSCTCLLPRERMNMREVASRLQSIRTSYVAAAKRKQVMIHIQ